MASRLPEHSIRWPAMRQRWCDVAFLHWAVPPDLLAPHLPEGFRVDTFDGRGYLALTPFRVGAHGIGPLPPPSAWAFPETNLRTYVTGPDGTDGLWFLAIDAASVPVTVGARLGLGAPYHWADMAVEREGPSVRYRSRRLTGDHAHHDIRITAGDPVSEPDRTGLLDWLTGRWRSWTALAGIAISSPVSHQPWPLQHAELVGLDESIFSAAGLERPTADPIVHHAPRVDARFGVSRPHCSRH